MTETVYKWTDSAGITHFSQQPPSEDFEISEIIEFDDPAPAPQAADNYYSVVNQARRMGEARRKREQENLDRRAQQKDYEDRDSYSSDTRYIPVYSYYGYQRPYRTGYHHGKRGYGRYSGYRPGIDKHPRSVPHRSAQSRHYPRGVINIGR